MQFFWKDGMSPWKTSPRSQTLIMILSFRKLAIWDHFLPLIASDLKPRVWKSLAQPLQEKKSKIDTPDVDLRKSLVESILMIKNLWNKQWMKPFCSAKVLFPFSKNCCLRKNISRRSKSVSYCLIYSMMKVVLRWFKMVLMVTLVNGFQSLTNVLKNSIVDVGRVLDRPLKTIKLL